MKALVDRAVDLLPGAELAAVLEELAGSAVPNARRVEVLQARSRQLAHDQAQLFAEMIEVSHTVALADVEGARDEVVARAADRYEWAAHEIAAALTWTPTAADRELGFAVALVERLPLVQEALLAGRIDRGKARVFADYLDPVTGDVTVGGPLPRHAQRCLPRPRRAADHPAAARPATTGGPPRPGDHDCRVPD